MFSILVWIATRFWDRQIWEPEVKIPQISRLDLVINEQGGPIYSYGR